MKRIAVKHSLPKHAHHSYDIDIDFLSDRNSSKYLTFFAFCVVYLGW